MSATVCSADEGSSKPSDDIEVFSTDVLVSLQLAIV